MACFIKLANFIRVAPGAAREQHREGLVTALGEAQTCDLRPGRLSQGASERAIELSQALPVAKGSTGGYPNEIEPNK